MEYLAGRSLRDFLTLRLRLGLKDTLSIMGQLLAALDFAHANGVVHRDVKPANVMMLLSGRLKLADFGIALIDTFDLSQTGPTAGSPAYMSPERHAGQEADRRSDIFSCGVVLYELLTGSRPFEGPPESIGEKICGEPYRPASDLNPNGSPVGLDAVLARALAKNPEVRFPTARDFASALESAFRESADTSHPPGVEESSRTIRREDSTALLCASLRLSPEDLRALEALFTRHVGPMAKILLKRAARTATDGSMLAGLLAQAIPDESGSKAFMAEAMEKLAAASPGGGGSPSMRFSRSLIEGAALDAAGLRLARYLGPIARVIAKKTPGRTTDLGAYYRQLAEYIADPADRARFLKEAGYGK